MAPRWLMGPAPVWVAGAGALLLAVALLTGRPDVALLGAAAVLAASAGRARVHGTVGVLVVQGADDGTDAPGLLQGRVELDHPGRHGSGAAAGRAVRAPARGGARVRAVRAADHRGGRPLGAHRPSAPVRRPGAGTGRRRAPHRSGRPGPGRRRRRAPPGAGHRRAAAPTAAARLDRAAPLAPARGRGRPARRPSAHPRRPGPARRLEGHGPPVPHAGPAVRAALARARRGHGHAGRRLAGRPRPGPGHVERPPSGATRGGDVTGPRARGGRVRRRGSRRARRPCRARGPRRAPAHPAGRDRTAPARPAPAPARAAPARGPTGGARPPAPAERGQPGLPVLHVPRRRAGRPRAHVAGHRTPRRGGRRATAPPSHPRPPARARAADGADRSNRPARGGPRRRDHDRALGRPGRHGRAAHAGAVVPARSSSGRSAPASAGGRRERGPGGVVGARPQRPGRDRSGVGGTRGVGAGCPGRRGRRP